jgi:hypothetical protein
MPQALLKIEVRTTASRPSCLDLFLTRSLWRGLALKLLDMRVQGVELAAKDGMFGKSDPYLKFWAIRKDGQLVEVHRTETISSNLNPEWKPFAVDLDKLCNGDLDAKFKLQCWDEDAVSAHDEIGWIETTVAQLLAKQPLVLNDLHTHTHTHTHTECVCVSVYIYTYVSMYIYIYRSSTTGPAAKQPNRGRWW